MRETVTYKATMLTGPSGMGQLLRSWCAQESHIMNMTNMLAVAINYAVNDIVAVCYF